MCVTVSMLARGSRETAHRASTRTRILSMRESPPRTFKRMKTLGREPHSLSAILIPRALRSRLWISHSGQEAARPVFMTGGTHSSWSRAVPTRKASATTGEVGSFGSGHSSRSRHRSQAFTIRTTRPIPWASRFDRGHAKSELPPIWDTCRSACAIICAFGDVLVMESNHDLEMLRGGPYPWRSSSGYEPRRHLSNGPRGFSLTTMIVQLL